jgi:hypothetical protein
MTKTWKQLDHEIEDQELADFAGGKFKYNALQRARLGFAVQGILQDRGIEARDLDDDALAALARAELARGQAPTPAAPPKKTVLGRGALTEDQARAMPRFDFIAHWLAVVTKKKENRGPLGLWVKHVGTRWQIMSPVGGGTVTFETTDPALLFDYARRGQLGRDIRDAEEFRAQAYQRAGLG